MRTQEKICNLRFFLKGCLLLLVGSCSLGSLYISLKAVTTKCAQHQLNQFEPELSAMVEQVIQTTTVSGDKYAKSDDEQNIKEQRKCYGKITGSAWWIANVRVGNELFLFSSLYGISKQTGKTIVLGNNSKLQSWFKHLDSYEKAKSQIDHYAYVSSLINKSCAYDPNYISQISCHPKKSITVLSGYLQSWKYFDFVKTELKQMLQARDEHLEAANSYVQRYLESENLNRNETFLVSVHVRRTDFVSLFMANAGYVSTTIGFLQRSMDYCRNNSQPQKSLVFLIVTDDPIWCEQHLQENKESLVVVRGNTPIVDFLILQQGDALVISSGSSTFSWWAAYLSDTAKYVLYNANYAQNGSSLWEQIVAEDYFYPSWIPLR